MTGLSGSEAFMTKLRVSYLWWMMGGWLLCSMSMAEPVTTPTGIFEGRGQVIYVNVEGGFYGLLSDDGQKYLPLSLPDSFQQDALRVKFTARLLSRSKGFRMWGQTIEILGITAADCTNPLPVTTP
jgi:hypothetical protein